MITFETTSTSAAFYEAGTTVVSLTGSEGAANYGATTSNVKDSTGGQTLVTTSSPWNSVFVQTFFSGTEETIVGEGSNTSTSVTETSSTGYNNADVTWRWFGGFGQLDFAFGITSEINSLGTSATTRYATAIEDPASEFITDLGTRNETASTAATTSTATTLSDWTTTNISTIGTSTATATDTESFWTHNTASGFHTTHRTITPTVTSASTLWRQTTTTSGLPTTLTGNQIIVTATTCGDNVALATKTAATNVSTDQTDTSYCFSTATQSSILPREKTLQSTVFGALTWATLPTLTIEYGEFALTGGYLGSEITYSELGTNSTSGLVTFYPTATTTTASAATTLINQVPQVTSGSALTAATDAVTRNEVVTFSSAHLALSKNTFSTTVERATTVSHGPATTTTFTTEATTAERLVLSSELNMVFPLGDEYTLAAPELPPGFSFETTNNIAFGDIGDGNGTPYTHAVTSRVTRASTWEETGIGHISTVAPFPATVMNPISYGVRAASGGNVGLGFADNVAKAATAKTLRFERLTPQIQTPVTGRGASESTAFNYKGAAITTRASTDSGTLNWEATGAASSYWTRPDAKLTGGTNASLASIPGALLLGGAGEALLAHGVYETRSGTESGVTFAKGNTVKTWESSAPVTAWRPLTYWTTSTSADTTSSFESLYRLTAQPLDEA